MSFRCDPRKGDKVISTLTVARTDVSVCAVSAMERYLVIRNTVPRIAHTVEAPDHSACPVSPVIVQLFGRALQASSAAGAYRQ